MNEIQEKRVPDVELAYKKSGNPGVCGQNLDWVSEAKQPNPLFLTFDFCVDTSSELYC